MGTKKSDVLREITDAMAAARYRVVRATTGQVCFARPGPSGTSMTAVEFNHEEAQLHVFRLLVEQDRGADMADIGAALTLLRARAIDAPAVEVYNRVAETTDGVIYVDLGDERRRVIEVRPGVWRESPDCPVYFNRPASMLALPDPARGGSIDRLWDVLRIDDSDVRWLCLGFVLSCLKERATHFLAVVQGPTGAGKTTLTDYLSRLLDPRDPQTPRIRRSADDVVAACAHRYVMAFDNMTALTPGQSGDLCAIATGSGQEGRRLYSNFGSCGASVQRPMVLNGIDGLLKRAEVRSRAVPIRLPSRRGRPHVPDEAIEDDFNREWGGILGAVLDLAAAGLADTGAVCGADRGRMVSSVAWVERCLRGAGLGAGRFLDAYTRARAEADDDAAGAWPLLPYILELSEGDGLEGLAQDVWGALCACMGKQGLPAEWPRSLEAFGSQLQDNEETMRRAGVEFTRRKTNRGMLYTFRQVAPAPQASSPTSPEAPAPAVEGVEVPPLKP
jgi:energy-coupling factor transporter ATP-binding protein EcfA2